MPGSIAKAVSRDRIVRTIGLAALLVCWPVSALATGAPRAHRTGLEVVTYRGYRVNVPRTWPVFDLARDPGVCVRFNRHAVYLGQPSPDQHCPAHAAGRTEALLLEPASARVASAGRGTGAGLPTLTDRVHGVAVTATWGADGGVIRRALGIRSLSALQQAADTSATATGRAAAARPAARAAKAAGATPGGVYTGLGFDVCSTPSSSQMSAWSSTSYHAVGVYIGGVNMACAQPNLSAAWVSRESAAGWHLIPIYVGLQAPSNSCGCGGISPTSAASQGRAAAVDAVGQAQGLGMGTGNPIYFDMEAYSRGGTNSQAVLAFLSGWTNQLHGKGYRSGVYSSDYSGISDLVSKVGTGYSEPDEIWIANWNGVKSTSDSNVPPSEWANHQRLHQYDGGHNETHRGVTLNIDGDYLDAATAAPGSGSSPAADPTVISLPTISGQPIEGQTLTEGHGTWSIAPTAYEYQWEDCNTAATSCVPIRGATAETYTLTGSDLGHRIRVVETALGGGGAGTAGSNPTQEVLSPVPLYWLYTAGGNVYPSAGTIWYGSPWSRGFRASQITGMAATADGQGYWLVQAAGRVFAFGDAPQLPRLAHAHPIRGIVAAPGGGYWLYTAYGNVYGTPGTPWYGSPRSRGFRGSQITGMAATPDGQGYWLVGTGGRVFAFGDAAKLPVRRRVRRIEGIVAAPGGGYWLFTAAGNVYGSSGTAWHGSPYARGFRGASVTGMAATADGQGYWLTDAGGQVFAYGDAGNNPPLSRVRGVAGITSG